MFIACRVDSFAYHILHAARDLLGGTIQKHRFYTRILMNRLELVDRVAARNTASKAEVDRIIVLSLIHI